MPLRLPTSIFSPGVPILPLAAVFLLLAGCGSGGADTSPGPIPAAIRVQTGNQQTGIAGTPLAAALSVVVTDGKGKPVGNRRVDWDVSAGFGSASPASSMTNGQGVATTIWTVGSRAGLATATAQITGLNPATFLATVLPGPASIVVAIPYMAFLEVGDTVRVRATVRDRFGNPLQNQAITFSSLDEEVASVDNAGLVTAITVGSARIGALAAGLADTVPVTVGPPGSAVCGSQMPRVLGVGEVHTPDISASNISVCLSAENALNAEYALTLISTATDFGSTTTIDVLGTGTYAPVFAAGIDPGAISFLPETGDLGSSSSLTSSVNAIFEMRRRLIERKELTPLTEDARAWQSHAASTSLGARVTSLAIGDIVKLNANASVACSSPDTRKGKIVAIGSRAMIVSDMDNPNGGYTDAEYASIAATFDTLVFPMDTGAFGAPSNISPYGKIILFYTRAVNALTPEKAGYTIGGFFFARDLYPKTARSGLQACPASNENEMFYLLVPDPDGTVNGNRRTKSEVTLLNLTTIAHELQHLINSSRRLYVNAGAVINEQTWLDEGLSHIAEELLYFRIGGFSSRQNLSIGDVSANQAQSEQFRNYASQNFSRLYNFLVAPETNSPYAPNDSLSTRGAIWSFLRYAAGRQGVGGEAQFFHALVNSTATGVANLQTVLSGSRFADYLRDWTVALIADDYTNATTVALGPAYTIPAWNLRSIYPALRFVGGLPLGVYPIATRSLRSNVPHRIMLAGGTSSYVRFSLKNNTRALITISSTGGTPPESLRLAFVRLR